MKTLNEIKASDRLPSKEGKYFVEYVHNNFQSSVYFNGKNFEIGAFEEIKHWYEPTDWISPKDKLPKNGDTVLIIRDVRNWDKKRKPYIDIAEVGFLERKTRIGGPISLTGYVEMEGIYFSVPAILHPESVTFWRPMPDFLHCL